MVADLTTQNNGVYYEAGYARGLNIPVVLTCKKDESRHFDISQVNTILWNDEDELYTLLQKRLIALQNK
jgi:nucleoside 2-deoxyribosyltransferase